MKKKFCISLIFFFAQICSSTSHPLQHQGSQKSGRIIDRARKFDLLDLDLDFFHKSNELNNIDKDEKYVPYESKNVDTKKTDSSKNKLEYANPVKAEESHTLLFRARQFGLNDKDLGLIDEKNESSDFVEDEKYVPYQSKNVDKNKPELKRISQSSKHIGKYYNTTQHDKKNKKREMLKNESVLEDLFLDNFEDTFKNEKESFFDRTEVLDDFKDAFKNGKDDFFDGTEVLDDFKQPENKLFEYQEKENYYNYALHNLKTDLALLKNEFDSVSRFFYITVNFKRYTESNSIMNASDLKKFLQQSNERLDIESLSNEILYFEQKAPSFSLLEIKLSYQKLLNKMYLFQQTLDNFEKTLKIRYPVVSANREEYEKLVNQAFLSQNMIKY